jgi:hypothetical protein
MFFVFLIMQHIQEISRNQLQMVNLEDKISTDNLVRFIDAFEDFINLEKVNFEPKTTNHYFMAVAKIQVPVKINFRDMVTYVQK